MLHHLFTRGGPVQPSHQVESRHKTVISGNGRFVFLDEQGMEIVEDERDHNLDGTIGWHLHNALCNQQCVLHTTLQVSVHSSQICGGSISRHEVLNQATSAEAQSIVHPSSVVLASQGLVTLWS